jgi:hypothetical protein
LTVQDQRGRNTGIGSGSGLCPEAGAELLAELARYEMLIHTYLVTEPTQVEGKTVQGMIGGDGMIEMNADMIETEIG